MKNRSKSNLPAKLARGRERFEKWRSKHKKRTRLPEQLWTAAVKLANEYGVNRTVQALRLDYSGLKKRMVSDVSGNTAQQQTTADAKFFQLLGTDLTTASECAIECEDAKGAKIRIHLKGAQFPDLPAALTALWNCDR